MPDIIDQVEAKAQNLISQFAHIKIEKTEIDIKSESSDIDESDKKFKQDVKSIKLKEAFKSESDTEWKKLCITNFDFINTQISSFKNKDVTAADLALQHDRDTLHMMFQSKTQVCEQEDHLA